jgi:2-methylisocitrate lyase-like PEP mutase family enzyme
MPCCFDALSAKMIHSTGFSLSFMTGFGVAASFGLPDTGMLSFGEVRDRAARIMEALPASFPVIGDGDTGYGNPINVKRTVKGFAQAGLAGILIEDQVNPKRCGHTQGKAVVERSEAIQRWRAAVDARNEFEDIVIIARTDAIATHGIDEALWRMDKALELGADVLFLEAPRSVAEMERFTRAFAGVPMLANMLENGMTPILPAKELEAMGYRIAAYPLTLLAASMKAMQAALVALHSGEPERVAPYLMDFAQVRDVVGFSWYDQESERYRSDAG